MGPITATAAVEAIGNGAGFKKGRGFFAWLGVVPGQHSTEGKQKLTCSSRCGNNSFAISSYKARTLPLRKPMIFLIRG
jgi:transposase